MNSFQSTVLNHFKQHAHEREFPWRPPLLKVDNTDTLNPYFVLLSEVMLQQTQAPRVVEKFISFTKRFPTVAQLAAASTAEVLSEWQGLGYNRRGLWLRDAAKSIVENHDGEVPDNLTDLKALKGIGPYTAGAILAFAYNHPMTFIETNIRDVFIWHFFKDQENISEAQLLEKIEAEIYAPDPRTWYYALMDYGTHLKKLHPEIKKKAKTYKKQSAFAGSNRELRANILKQLLEKPCTVVELSKKLNKPTTDIRTNLTTMKKDGLITSKETKWLVEST